MALDTTPGSATADSYVSLEDSDAYHLAHGGEAWLAPSVDDERKEAALRSATRYLDSTYRGRWKGIRAAAAQALAWPRREVIDEDGYDLADDAIPKAIVDATCEAALLIVQGVQLMPQLARGGMVKSESVTAGPVSTTTTFMDSAPGRDRFLAIEGALSGLIERALGGAAIVDLLRV